MLKLTLRSLRARTLRYALASIAVVLGVTFVVGSLVVTDSLRGSFDELSGAVAGGVDAQVRTRDPFGRAPSIDNQLPPVPAVLADTVAGVDGVALASGDVEVPLTVVTADGELVDAGGAPVLGFNWDGPGRSAGPFSLAEGEAPTGGHVAVDVATARRFHIAVGDLLDVRAAGATQRFGVSGLARLGGENASGAASFLFDTATAQALSGTAGEFRTISVAAGPGVTQSELVRRVAAALPDGYEVVSGQQVAREFAGSFDGFVTAFRWVLLVFGIVALLVSTFLVSNTFAIVLGQRVRELGMLRAVGARQRQLVAVVLGEAAAIGLLGSAVGALAGIGVGALLRWLVSTLGGGRLPGGLVVESRTWVVALVVGTVVTVGASFVPAWRAGRVPPVAVMRDGAGASPGRGLLVVRLVVGALAATSGALLVVLGLAGAVSGAGAVLLATGVGALLTFVGVALLSVLVAGPATRTLGRRPLAVAMLALGGVSALGAVAAVVAGVGRLNAPALAALGGAAVLAVLAWLLLDSGLGGLTLPGRLARENVARNPRRSTSTAAALMVGLALVCMASVIGESLKATIASQVDGQLSADYVFTGRSDQGMSPQLARDLAALPEVGAVAMVRQGAMRVGGETKQVSALPATAASDVLRLRFLSGGFGGLDDHGVAVQRDAARDLGLRVGDTVDAEFVQTGHVPLRVTGIFDRTIGGLGNWLVGTPTFEANFAAGEQRDLFGAATRASGVDAAAAERAIDAVVADYPEVRFEDRATFRRTQQRQVDRPLAVVDVLLGFALLNALFGIANTMALSVVERTREIGILRAVGMSRRQARRMVRWEAVVVSAFGAALGIALGLAFGAALAAAIPDDIVSGVAVPVPTIAVVGCLAVLFALVAAVLPARRAGRLDVLQAIAAD